MGQALPAGRWPPDRRRACAGGSHRRGPKHAAPEPVVPQTAPEPVVPGASSPVRLQVVPESRSISLPAPSAVVDAPAGIGPVIIGQPTPASRTMRWGWIVIGLVGAVMAVAALAAFAAAHRTADVRGTVTVSANACVYSRGVCALSAACSVARAR